MEATGEINVAYFDLFQCGNPRPDVFKVLLKRHRAWQSRKSRVHAVSMILRQERNAILDVACLIGFVDFAEEVLLGRRSIELDHFWMRGGFHCELWGGGRVAVRGGG